MTVEQQTQQQAQQQPPQTQQAQGGEDLDTLVGFMDDGAGSAGDGASGAAEEHFDADGNPIEEQAQEQQVEDQTKDQDPTYKVKVDGVERELKLSELTANAQKYLSGDRRLEEAAAVRKALEPERQAVVQERTQLRQALDHFITQSSAFVQAFEPDWNALLNHDPNEYTRQRHIWEARVGQVQQAIQSRQALEQRSLQDQATDTQARAAEEYQQLLTKIPEWRDAEKQKAESRAVGGYLLKEGLTDAELGNLSDHRVLVIARKAMLFDQLLAKKDAATNKAKAAPVARGNLRPGARQSPTGQVNNNSAAYERFNKDPSVDTLAALMN